MDELVFAKTIQEYPEFLVNPTHKDSLSHHMTQAEASNDYTDVHFTFDDETVPCHKVILASPCEYFHELFQGQFKDSTEVPVTNMTISSFKSIRQFIYTGLIMVQVENTFDLLQAAIEIGFEPLQSLISTFMASKFQRVRQSKKYVSMSQEAIALVLAEKNLVVSSEESICSHLLAWVDHSPEERIQVLNQLLLTLRLECLAPEYIEYTLLSNQNVIKNKDAIEKLHCVLRHILYNDSIPPFLQSHLPRTQTDICNGLAVISLSDGLHTMFFGLNESGEMTLIRESSVRKGQFHMDNAQACVIRNMVYFAAVEQNSFKFLKTNLFMLDYLGYKNTSTEHLWVSGKKNELIFIEKSICRSYNIETHTWQRKLTIWDFSVEKPQHGEKWYLSGNTSQHYYPGKTNHQKTYGALLDQDKIFIFGARPNTDTESSEVSKEAVNILRICRTEHTVAAIEITLPKEVVQMEVISYKEHVILAGSNTIQIIKLEDLHRSGVLKIDDDTDDDINDDINEVTDDHTNDHTDDTYDHTDDIDNTRGEDVENDARNEAAPNSNKVITSYLEPMESIATNNAKVCRMGHQLIYFTKSEEKWSIWSADLEDVIQNKDEIEWTQRDNLAESEQEKLNKQGDFSVVPIKFSRK